MKIVVILQKMCFLGSEWDSLMEVHHEPIEKNYELLEEIGKWVFNNFICYSWNIDICLSIIEVNLP